MKKFLLSAGAVLLVAGLGLSWLGLRLGGEVTATIHLFGRSWNVYAPTAGWGGGAVVSEAVAQPPRVSAGITDSSSGAVVEELVPVLPGTDGQAFSQEQEGAAPFSSICLDVDLAEVTIAAGDSYDVEIRTRGTGYKVEHWYSGDTLYIEDTDNDIELLPKNYGCDITVYVPAGTRLDSLYVDVDLGSLTLAGLRADNVQIDLDLGSLTGEALTFSSLNVDADLGEVSLFGDLGEYVDIGADLGSVYLGLSRPAGEYSWELEADMGSVTVDGRKQRLDEDNKAIGGYGGRFIEVDADMGSITLDFGQDFGQDFSQDFGGEIPNAVSQQAGTAPVSTNSPSAEIRQGETTFVAQDGETAEN